MDPADVTSDEWGYVRRTPGAHGYLAFHPRPLARELSLSPETVALQSTADLALGRLSGAGRILPNTEPLLAPYALQESLDSSRIEVARKRRCPTSSRRLPRGTPTASTSRRCSTTAPPWTMV